MLIHLAHSVTTLLQYLLTIAEKILVLANPLFYLIYYPIQMLKIVSIISPNQNTFYNLHQNINYLQVVACSMLIYTINIPIQDKTNHNTVNVSMRQLKRSVTNLSRHECNTNNIPNLLPPISNKTPLTLH